MSAATLAAWAVCVVLMIWLAPALAPVLVLGLLGIAVHSSDETNR